MEAPDELTDEKVLSEEELRNCSTHSVLKMISRIITEAIIASGLIMEEILGRKKNADLHLFIYSIAMVVIMLEFRQKINMYIGSTVKLRKLMQDHPVETQAFIDEGKRSNDRDIASGTRWLDWLRQDRENIENRKSRKRKL